MMLQLTQRQRILRKPSWLTAITTGLSLFCWLPLSSAHTGPPVPILVDAMLSAYLVSVWAYPEVGTGTFFIQLESLAGGDIADDIRVQVGVQPVSGRLAEAHYPAQRQKGRGRVQYQADVPFDAQELWRARIIVHSTDGSGETTVDVEVTPPGFGHWDVLLYLFPFLTVGLLGLQVLLYKRKRSQGRVPAPWRG